MKLKHQYARTPKRLRGCKGGIRPILTDKQVDEIRRKYEDVELASYNTLAVDFGVNPSTIRHVIQHLGAYQDV